jgi:hypothetical protein
VFHALRHDIRRLAMVAAASAGQGSAVSSQTHSVDGSGGAKRAGGKGKSALGAFARLLAGLTRKTAARSEGANGVGAEAGAGAEKPLRGAKNAAGKNAEAPGGKIPAPGAEKNHLRDRRFLTALKGEGEAPVSDAGAQRGSVKKSKQIRENPEAEEAALLAVAEAAPGALTQDNAVPAEPESGETSGLAVRPGQAAAEDPVADGSPAFRAGRLEAAETAANAEAAERGGAETAPKAGAGASRQARGTEAPETGKKDKAAETRNSRKNRERFALEVRDLRTEGAAPETAQELRNGAEAGTERVADITVDLKSDGRNPDPFQPGREKTAGQAFEDILARELHQNLNGDIVRQASIMVKDGGEGTIRLSLKPESLGMVKVRLEMADNKITGRIIVESNEAFRAFEKEIHSLEQAFRDSGFAGASLDMALAGDGGQNGRGQWDGDTANPLLSLRTVSSSYDAMAETMDVLAMDGGFDGFAGPGVSRVNVLV